MRERLLEYRRWPAAFLLLFGAGVVMLLINSCTTTSTTVVTPPHVEGAHYVGDKSCADCHGNITRAFPTSPHGRLNLGKSAMSGHHGCESCHGPASKHVALGAAGREFIVNPGKNPESCFQCHHKEHAEFNFPEHHPVIEGKMNCIQCHDPHGLDSMKPAGGLAMARVNQTCAQCHREQAKPVAFEHAAMREGCTSCHSPHGSINPKMLTARDSNLCIRCHAQVPGVGTPGKIYIGSKDHSNYLRYGTCWIAGCHTAVHGSNVQVFFLY